MKIIRTITLYCLAVVMTCSAWISPAAYASQGTIFFTPSSGRFDPGSTFTINVRTNVAPPGSFAGGATVIVQFPKNILQVTSASTSGSAFGGYTSINNGAGTVNYTAFLFAPPSGSNLHLFSITFKAVGTGTAPVSFGAGTNVHDGPTSFQNASYTIASPPTPTCPAGMVGTPPNCTTPPAPTCPAGMVGTPPNCTTPPKPSPTPNPTPKPSPTPNPTPPLDSLIVPTTPEPAPTTTATGSLTITGVKATPAWDSGTVAWSTNQPDVTTVMQFGTSKNKLTTTINAQAQGDGSFRASQTKLAPGTRYYYLINAISTSNGGQATYSGSFTTRGYPTKLILLNNKQPAGGAVIKLDSGSYTANKDGVIQFELAAGDFKPTITGTDGVAKTVNFAVKRIEVPANGKAPATQTFTLDIGSEESQAGAGNILPIILSIIGGLLLIGLFLIFLLWRRRRAENAALPVASADDYTWSAEQQPTAIQSVEQQYLPEAEQPFAELGVSNIDPSVDTSLVNPIEGTIDSTQETPFAPIGSVEQPLYSTEDIYANSQLTPIVEPTVTDSTYPPSEASFATEAVPYQDTPPVYQSDEQLMQPPQDITEDTSLTPTHDVTIEEVSPDEPSATYDESTGELSIIHHQNTHTPRGVS